MYFEYWFPVLTSSLPAGKRQDLVETFVDDSSTRRALQVTHIIYSLADSFSLTMD